MNDLTTRISMSLPPGLLEAFDKVSHQSGYADRSKALQAAYASIHLGFRKRSQEG